MSSATILIVEDLEDTVFGYKRYLEAIGYSTETVSTCKDALKMIQREVIDLVLLDLDLPDGSGLDLIEPIRTALPGCGIIIITGSGDIQHAVTAMKTGADNFLTKPVEMDELVVSIEKSLELEKLRRKEILSNRLLKKSSICFGTSQSMAQVRKFAEIAARNESAILITGETGTGKGMLAKWIHEQSERSSANCVEVNCSSLKGELLRSELYGHTKGAFTSAVKDRPGLIEAADGGTLFLDEIGDMDLEVQAQLLKTLEEKKFRRIGENKLRSSDFRIICATNKDMETEVEEGRFRSDLYYRIAVFPIEIPSLNERGRDLADLCSFFFTQFNYPLEKVPSEVFEHLVNRTWKGNIRELRNAIERALLLAENGELNLTHFTMGRSLAASSAVTMVNEGETWNLEEIEKRTIIKALEHFNNNKSEVCRKLGISSSSLYRKIERYGLTLA